MDEMDAETRSRLDGDSGQDQQGRRCMSSELSVDAGLGPSGMPMSSRTHLSHDSVSEATDDEATRRDAEHDPLLESTEATEETNAAQEVEEKATSVSAVQTVNGSEQSKSMGDPSEAVKSSEAEETVVCDDPAPKASIDSTLPAGELSAASLSAFDEEQLERTHKTFPEKLMELLDEETVKESLWWLDGGDAFAIVPKAFPEKVLNDHFQGTKFESFTRKLNRWGFKRVAGQRVPVNTLAYHHPMFSKGKPELIINMRSGRKREAAYNPYQEEPKRQYISIHSDEQALAQPPPTAKGGFMSNDMFRMANAQPSPEDELFLLRQHEQMMNHPHGGSAYAQQMRLHSLMAAQQSADMMLQREAQLLQTERAIQQLQMQRMGQFPGQDQRLASAGGLYGSHSLGNLPGGLSDPSSLQGIQGGGRAGLPQSAPSGQSATGNASLYELVLLEERRKRLQEDMQRRGP